MTMTRNVGHELDDSSRASWHWLGLHAQSDTHQRWNPWAARHHTQRCISKSESNCFYEFNSYPLSLLIHDHPLHFPCTVAMGNSRCFCWHLTILGQEFDARLHFIARAGCMCHLMELSSNTANTLWVLPGLGPSSAYKGS